MAFSLDTPSAQSLKAEARALREDRSRAGTPISHGAALEEVARTHGYRDWNTARAMLPDRVGAPVQVGDRVKGSYLGQPFKGLVIGVTMMVDMRHFQVTVTFDEPVDVVKSQLFSAFRQRVTATVDAYGVSSATTSDGQPHMRLTRI
jgi:hypothetical protein